MLFTIVTVLLVATQVAHTNAQAFVNDNDGWLDVGERPDFPSNPASGSRFLSSIHFRGKGIEDLDGANLLTNLRGQRLNLSRNEIASVENGDFIGLENLAWLDLSRNLITSIESGDFLGLENLESLDLSVNSIVSIERDDFDGLDNLQRLLL